jgi:hypothetical protein
MADHRLQASFRSCCKCSSKPQIGGKTTHGEARGTGQYVEQMDHPVLLGQKLRVRTALSLSAISKTSTGIMIVLYICIPPCSLRLYQHIICGYCVIQVAKLSEGEAKRKKVKRGENSRKRMCGHPLE